MLFRFVLARAESTDPTVSNLSTVLSCAFILLLAGALAFVPVLIAWSRRSRHSEAIAAIATLWALGVAISVGATVISQMKYSQEHQSQIMSGYLDPRDTTDAPQLPWLTWAGLGAAYAGLLVWPLVGPRNTTDRAT